MRELVRRVLAPVLAAWIASKSSDIARLPRPEGRLSYHSNGPGDHRVLIFGGGPAIGWGVLTNDLALPGTLSRALTERTGGGSTVTVHPVIRVMVRSALADLGELDLRDYDSIVLFIGVNDSGALTSLAHWKRDLTAVLALVCERSPLAHVYLAGVHPLRSIPLFDRPLGSVADAHARDLNASSQQICSLLPRVTFVPLTAPPPIGSLRFRDSSSYRHWADEIVSHMVRMPQVGAPG